MKRVSMLIVFLFLGLAGCAATIREGALSLDEIGAVCTAQRFLDENGYFDRENIDRSKIVFQLFDELNYYKNGAWDYDSLLRDRRGLFSGRLYAYVPSETTHIVLYKLPETTVCVKIVKLTGEIILTESGCSPSLVNARYVSGSKLRCDIVS